MGRVGSKGFQLLWLCDNHRKRRIGQGKPSDVDAALAVCQAPLSHDNSVLPSPDRHFTGGGQGH